MTQRKRHTFVLCLLALSLQVFICQAAEEAVVATNQSAGRTSALFSAPATAVFSDSSRGRSLGTNNFGSTALRLLSSVLQPVILAVLLQQQQQQLQQPGIQQLLLQQQLQQPVAQQLILQQVLQQQLLQQQLLRQQLLRGQRGSGQQPQVNRVGSLRDGLDEFANVGGGSAGIGGLGSLAGLQFLSSPGTLLDNVQVRGLGESNVRGDSSKQGNLEFPRDTVSHLRIGVDRNQNNQPLVSPFTLSGSQNRPPFQRLSAGNHLGRPPFTTKEPQPSFSRTPAFPNFSSSNLFSARQSIPISRFDERNAEELSFVRRNRLSNTPKPATDPRVGNFRSLPLATDIDDAVHQSRLSPSQASSANGINANLAEEHLGLTDSTRLLAALLFANEIDLLNGKQSQSRNVNGIIPERPVKFLED